MIVLNHNGGREAFSVGEAAAREDRLFFQCTKSGRGFARGSDARGGLAD